jgi:hypothetical protein
MSAAGAAAVPPEGRVSSLRPTITRLLAHLVTIGQRDLYEACVVELVRERQDARAEAFEQAAEVARGYRGRWQSTIDELCMRAKAERELMGRTNRPQGAA